MKNATLIGTVAILGIAASASSAAITTIDMQIQTDTFDNFRFSVLHTAESNNGMSGRIIAEFTGSMRVEHDDRGTQTTADDTVTVTRFEGNISGTGRNVDMKLDASRGASVFNLGAGTTSAGGYTMSGSLNLQIFDGTWKAIPYNFTQSTFNSLANQFFIGGDPQDPTSQYTIGLWGLSDNPENALGETTDLGMDLVARGRAIPMPTPLAMAGAGIFATGLIRRRR